MGPGLKDNILKLCFHSFSVYHIAKIAVFEGKPLAPVTKNRNVGEG